MKNFLIAMSLVLASCTSTMPGSVPIAPDGPVARTIERVLVRTEAYLADPELHQPITLEQREVIEAAIFTARTMTQMPEVSGDLLLVSMAGLMQLHDALVETDPDLDQLEREIYLEDTARLRSLFQSVNIHAELVRN